MEIEIKKLHPNAIIPEYAHAGDSGCDLFSVEETIINHGEIGVIKTGLSIAVPVGFEAQVRPKSGLALKAGLTVLNTPGTVDAGYRGEIGVILINHGDQYQIKAGQKIAQLVICPVVRAKFVEVSELDTTARGEGSYGSTGLEKCKN